VNLILLFARDFVDGRTHVRLEGRRLAHVREIHRARVGDVLRVGLLDGPMGTGRVARLDADALEMEVELSTAPPPPLEATLVLGLPRPLILKRVLHSATAMGVKRIVLLHARRVEKTFWNASAMQPEKLREQLVLGLEQARDTRMPELLLRRRFRPFVEDELSALAARGAAFVAHPEAADGCPQRLPTPATLAVGPEGGFLDHEIALLRDSGLVPVRLGARVLRVDTAVPFLLSRLATAL